MYRHLSRKRMLCLFSKSSHGLKHVNHDIWIHMYIYAYIYTGTSAERGRWSSFPNAAIGTPPRNHPALPRPPDPPEAIAQEIPFDLICPVKNLYMYDICITTNHPAFPRPPKPPKAIAHKIPLYSCLSVTNNQYRPIQHFLALPTHSRLWPRR